MLEEHVASRELTCYTLVIVNCLLEKMTAGPLHTIEVALLGPVPRVLRQMFTMSLCRPRIWDQR